MGPHKAIPWAHGTSRYHFMEICQQPAEVSSLAFCPADSIVSKGSETTDDQYSYFSSATSAYIPDIKPYFS